MAKRRLNADAPEAPPADGERSVDVIGPLRVAVGGTTVELRPAQRRVLSILLLNPGVALDREALIDRMWGDAVPPTAATALQVHLSGIRRSAPGVLVSRGSSYAVEPKACRIDRLTFEVLAQRAGATARDGSWQQALAIAAEAAALWRGAPFDELRDDEFAAATIARLEAIRDELDDVRVRALLAQRRDSEAIVELRVLVRQHPLRESLWESLMLAFYRAGRQAEAMRAFQEVRAILGRELGVEPGAGLRHLEERIVAGDETLGASEGPDVATNLPMVLTSFVGREADLRAVAELLETRRLVTIAGGPGLGKTRLAIEAGHAAAADHPDGVWFVRLADARSPLDVIGAIAAVAGVRSQALSLPELAGRLADRHAVLVLDNCEHQLDACADLARQVLSRDGPLRILATSRRALGLPGEAIWNLASLSPPEVADERVDARSALRSAAVRLFVDRARGVDRSFRLTAESAPLVAALCRRADGIPLALELAAAWIPALGLSDIAPMLTGDLEPDGPGRRPGRPEHHRSLQAAIDWSVTLLAPDDLKLFQSAAVFRGPFGLDDVLAVCPVGGERRRTAAAIRRLVEASLVVADRRADGNVRYRMLVPIHEFARGRLQRRPDWVLTRDRFVSHYLGKFKGEAPGPLPATIDPSRVDDDLDCLREAFALGLATGRADEVVRAIVPLDGYFQNRYLAREQREWLATALPLVRDATTRAHGLRSAAFAAQATNGLDEALRLLEAALTEFRTLRDQDGIARCLLSLAGLHSNRGEWSAGLAAAREARSLFEDGARIDGVDDPASIGVAAHYAGTNLAYSGQVADGVLELIEAVEQFRRAGDPDRGLQSLGTLTYLGAYTGDEALARRFAAEAVPLARRSDLETRMVRALSAAAAAEARFGDLAEARRLLMEVDDRMQAQANEIIFEILFPAGFVVRRLSRWDLLAELVHAVEAAIAATGQGYPAPHRDTAAAWLRDAATNSPGARPRSALGPARTVDEVRRDVRVVLEAG